MTRVNLEWLVWAIAMILFSELALSGRWIQLGVALTVTGVLWYALVPEHQPRRQ